MGGLHVIFGQIFYLVVNIVIQTDPHGTFPPALCPPTSRPSTGPHKIWVHGGFGSSDGWSVSFPLPPLWDSAHPPLSACKRCLPPVWIWLWVDSAAFTVCGSRLRFISPRLPHHPRLGWAVRDASHVSVVGAGSSVPGGSGNSKKGGPGCFPRPVYHWRSEVRHHKPEQSPL